MLTAYALESCPMSVILSQVDCLFNRLSNRISKKWSKQRTIGHLWEKFAGNSESTRAWWRYQMIIYSALLALWTGNSPVTTEFPSHRPVMQSFDVFFDLPLNKRLSKQSWGWWFEMQSRSLWRHCNGCKKPFHGMSSSYAWGILQLCNYMCNLSLYRQLTFNVCKILNCITLNRHVKISMTT